MNKYADAIIASHLIKFDKDINKYADKLAQKEFKKICKTAEHETYTKASICSVPGAVPSADVGAVANAVVGAVVGAIPTASDGAVDSSTANVEIINITRTQNITSMQSSSENSLMISSTIKKKKIILKKK